MTVTETEISNALDGVFWRVRYDGTITRQKLNKPPSRREPYNGKNVKWTDLENETLIHLHRGKASIEAIMASMGRDRNLIQWHIKELTAQGVLEPRRRGNWRKA